MPPPSVPPPVPAPPAELAGDYMMTLDLGSGCDVIPKDERMRTYEATITSEREASYFVTLTSGTFLRGLICTLEKGLGCHQFRAGKEGDMVRFDLDNSGEFHGGLIVERPISLLLSRRLYFQRHAPQPDAQVILVRRRLLRLPAGSVYVADSTCVLAFVEVSVAMNVHTGALAFAA